MSTPRLQRRKIWPKYVDAAGHAILHVDNTTNIADSVLVNRPSVRATSRDKYDLGSIFIADVGHMPFGCSVGESSSLLIKDN
ncbi:hypothetical protein C8J56DRAFT_1057927 [Mycena floridula]|nr:hypothetical protein C8J56DRAFT_1057927 [Mycena floridula]